ncbi:hypothetical protein HK097_004002 [Rhizophlyctis rosea]|uniref:CHCH domain-containing protein n=1 Tax=Rhizophlyctis rosea TaxID=64517 RepID=A0AAD5WXM0_9FUNG|nr:hypothetical protein HK097_004002 [Rhizophlyctis rosea]
MPVQPQHEQPPQSSPHTPRPPTDEDDPYVARIKRSGCFNQHEALQDCYYVKRDWRACKEEMQAFRACFAKKQQEQQ